MGLFLLLSLLLLPSRLQAGRSAECDLSTNYGIKQPDHLSALKGGSVRIPFSFYHDWELAKKPRVSVALRRTHFHGEVIYNSTLPSIHKDYKNRISLELSNGQRSGSLTISNLQEKDGNIYFCRIQVETLRCGKKVWQALNGTKLTITPALTTTTPAPTTGLTTTGVGDLEDTKSSASSLLTVGAAVGVALAVAGLIIAILGLILYLRRKRSKGLKTNARAGPKGSFQNTEEKYENIGIKRQQTEPWLEPKLEPKDEAQDNPILYASLTLSSSSSPAAPPRLRPKEDPQEETLYSLVKA
ncbi:paired immunoglobulin-like type 2 receptor alpha isoform X2 [Meles meles]|uniref:paired immunoglobulin-like type 2 receptor alpha isoform X2 n=1 Tax=Meles meles TaxID=9662 RepID=UPI001E69E994|nr:paired immunoglobulin-like type 2 receptor alpha isoform X2 [Meles meles]